MKNASVQVHSLGLGFLSSLFNRLTVLCVQDNAKQPSVFDVSRNTVCLTIMLMDHDVRTLILKCPTSLDSAAVSEPSTSHHVLFVLFDLKSSC